MVRAVGDVIIISSGGLSGRVTAAAPNGLRLMHTHTKRVLVPMLAITVSILHVETFLPTNVRTV